MSDDESGFGLNRPTNETLQKAGKYIARFVSEPADTLSKILDDHLRHIRIRRLASLEAKTIEHLRTLGYDAPPRTVSLKVIIPLLQSASLEEDDDLQDTWAALLANASTPELGHSISVAFVEMLRAMGSLEVQILSRLYHVRTGSPDGAFYTKNLPREAKLYQDTDGEVDLPPVPVQVAVWNLIRLGCLTAESMATGSRSAGLVALTALGENFVQACTIERKRRVVA